MCSLFFFQAEDGIRDHCVTGVQTCALPIYPSHPLARALKQGMTEKAFERYRTRRRRIRSYFGSEANIASAALTIGAKGTTKGWLCGYYLRLAGKSGVKGLQASEGYSNSPAPEARPAWCVIHALRELYLLQLET